MAYAFPVMRSEQFRLETCCECGVEFALSGSLHAERLRDGKLFWCPNGHKQYYSRKERTEQENERLKAELERERQKVRMLRSTNETTERRRRAAQGVATKRKKKLDRVANGVCPCCNRSFQNLAKHMKGQHPEFRG